MKRLFITLTLTLLAFMANAQSCPDNNHPHAIDLGLPSGTKWACCNVGATAPEGRGSYYAWGETEEKEKYEWTNYTHCDGSIDTCHDLGSDIAGTEYDVAHVKWGNSWVMPSQDQIKELASNCSCTWTRINGVYGDLFTGPNGSTVFLPEASFWRNDGKYGETDVIPSVGFYWSSTLRMSYTNFASYLSCSYGNVYWDNYNARCMGITVRPVISKVTAKETSYHPFVERGKHWCVHGFSMGSQHTVTDYYFSADKILFERNGHSYEQLRARTEDGKDELVGWFREENQRVYMYNEEEDKEVLTYDFSLKVGDRFEPEYGDFEHCEVTKIDYLMVYGDSLKVINFEANDKTSDTAVRVNGRWIEGVGSEMNPLDGLFSHSAPNSWSYYLAYVSGSSYWPFTFSQPYNGWWGQSLETIIPKDVYEQYEWNQQQENLNYEMGYNVESNTYDLHVSGFMDMNCGPNHYIYCIDEQTTNSNIHRLTLQHEDVPPLMDCEGGHKVDFVIPGFNKDCTYTVVDERGEHPVTVRETTYRPFIEEGKVWRTGVTFPNISFEHLYDYYIMGDTIIDNRVCKKFMQSELQYLQYDSCYKGTSYVASLYEEGKRVYVVWPGNSNFELVYDFASPVGSHIDIDGYNIIVTRKEENTAGCFKGRCVYVGLEDEQEYSPSESCWMEGVGIDLYPLYSLNRLLPTGLLQERLIYCSVGDEVLYYNQDLAERIPFDNSSQVKKQWIDFTHTTKPRPKAPLRVGSAGESEETLTGEYSVKQLFVNLKILSGTYTVTLRDAADNEVYRKKVQTSSTIALNTDLTKYAAGTYTLAVENSEEQYTATLTLPLDDTAVRDIPSDQIVNSKSLNSKCFDLSGRQFSTPPAKGIYIRDGKKVVVK